MNIKADNISRDSDDEIDTNDYFLMFKAYLKEMEK